MNFMTKKLTLTNAIELKKKIKKKTEMFHKVLALIS